MQMEENNISFINGFTTDGVVWYNNINVGHRIRIFQ